MYSSASRPWPDHPSSCEVARDPRPYAWANSGSCLCRFWVPLNQYHLVFGYEPFPRACDKTPLHLIFFLSTILLHFDVIDDRPVSEQGLWLGSEVLLGRFQEGNFDVLLIHA